ncbi:hypothetical protein RvY_17365 [Ramazzottius varieornatus]|uniref:Uncharacterized protein n=1 Tax=Ramazzottius varieornatus TaxID=947166 RepID=A0A1D1W2B7_RAMVA|nr:hypothetical protein RvY_17365 [Ramazzottius varieornatus]
MDVPASYRAVRRDIKGTPSVGLGCLEQLVETTSFLTGSGVGFYYPDLLSI